MSPADDQPGSFFAPHEFQLDHRIPKEVLMSLHRLLLVSLTAAVSIQNLPLKADDTDAAEPTSANRPVTVFFPGWSPTQQRIHAALDDKTTVNFNDTPLIDGIQFLAKQHDINIAIDVPALEESGITTDEPINVVLSGISLRSALQIVLTNLQLDYVVRNEVLRITTLERAGASYATRVYPVSDLVSRENDETWDELVDALHATAGTKWATEKNPGGSVAVVRKAGCVVVSQTDRGHDEVVELLESLREAQRFEADQSAAGRNVQQEAEDAGE